MAIGVARLCVRLNGLSRDTSGIFSMRRYFRKFYYTVRPQIRNIEKELNYRLN